MPAGNNAGGRRAAGRAYTPGQRSMAVVPYFMSGSEGNVIASLSRQDQAKINQLRQQYHDLIPQYHANPRSRGAIARKQQNILFQAKRIAMGEETYQQIQADIAAMTGRER